MALKWRNGRPYYYRSERRGDRVISEYIASGPLALLARDLAEAARSERASREEAQRRDRESCLALEGKLDERAARSGAIARAALESAGYRRHKRGEWRKRRMNATTTEQPRAACEPTPEAPRPPGRPAEAGTPSPGPSLDLSCRHHLIEWATGASPGEQHASAMREIDRARRDLAGPNPSPAEEHLAETAALCWFSLRAHEIKHAQRMARPKDYSHIQADFDQKSIARAQRRFESALKALAQVRRIELPSLRVHLSRHRPSPGPPPL